MRADAKLESDGYKCDREESSSTRRMFAVAYLLFVAIPCLKLAGANDAVLPVLLSALTIWIGYNHLTDRGRIPHYTFSPNPVEWQTGSASDSAVQPGNLTIVLAKGLAILLLPGLLYAASIHLVSASIRDSLLNYIILYSVFVMFFATHSISATLLVSSVAFGQRGEKRAWAAHIVRIVICVALAFIVIVSWIRVDSAVSANRQLYILPTGFSDVNEIRRSVTILDLLGVSVGLPSLLVLLGAFWRTWRSTQHRSWGQLSDDNEIVQRHSIPHEIVHLSDVHLTNTNDHLSIEGRSHPDGSPGRARFTGMNAKFSAVLQHFGARIETCDAIVISGDLTDTGSSAEWEQFFLAVSQHPDLLKKSVVCPGNHDVNVVSNEDLWATEPGPLRRARLLRTIIALDKIQGERSYCVVEQMSERGESVLSEVVSVRNYLLPRRKALIDSLSIKRGYVDNPSVSFDGLIDAVWRNLFPMLVYVERDGRERDSVVFAVMDSNLPGTTILTNGRGDITDTSFQKLARLFCFSPRHATRIAVMHHHLRPTKQPGREKFKEAFLGLCAPKRVASRLAHMHVSLILHGHTHVADDYEVEGVRVLGSQSTTLGCAARCPGCPADCDRMDVPGIRVVRLMKSAWGETEKLPRDSHDRPNSEKSTQG